jgi:hypothetical protein
VVWRCFAADVAWHNHPREVKKQEEATGFDNSSAPAAWSGRLFYLVLAGGGIRPEIGAVVCEVPARRDDATTFWRLTLPWPKDVVAPALRDVATAAPARRPAILNYRGCLYPVWENTRHCLAAGAVLLGVAGLRRRQGYGGQVGRYQVTDVP